MFQPTAPASQNLDFDIQKLGGCNIHVLTQVIDKSLSRAGRSRALRPSLFSWLVISSAILKRVLPGCGELPDPGGIQAEARRPLGSSKAPSILCRHTSLACTSLWSLLDPNGAFKGSEGISRGYGSGLFNHQCSKLTWLLGDLDLRSLFPV